MNVGIILAAGVGSRFKSDKPKQFFLLNGKPVLYYTIKSFVDSQLFDKIIVVLSKQYLRLGVDIFQKYFESSKNIFSCEGGQTRQDSLYNGVKYALDNFGDSDIKIVSHCAARPLLSKAVLQKNLDLITRGKSVDTVKRVYDTMLYTNSEGNTGFINRDKLFVGLTPQSFYAVDYIKAYNFVKNRINEFTCACSLMKEAGFEINLFVTDEPIHKITVLADVNILKQQLKEMGG
jgi:2-C-methyl-D-erythritol 4-phosphate cytidylyltransferase